MLESSPDDLAGGGLLYLVLGPKRPLEGRVEGLGQVVDKRRGGDEWGEGKGDQDLPHSQLLAVVGLRKGVEQSLHHGWVNRLSHRGGQGDGLGRGLLGPGHE